MKYTRQTKSFTEVPSILVERIGFGFQAQADHPPSQQMWSLSMRRAPPAQDQSKIGTHMGAFSEQ
eukprot:300409-Amphidinium_carterae.1